MLFMIVSSYTEREQRKARRALLQGLTGIVVHRTGFLCGSARGRLLCYRKQVSKQRLYQLHQRATTRPGKCLSLVAEYPTPLGNATGLVRLQAARVQATYVMNAVC